MAVVPRLQGLAGRWQIPLFAVSVGLFVTGLLHSCPVVHEVTFEDVIKGVRVDLQADQFERASQTLTSLLNTKDLKDLERAKAYRLLAETIWQAEALHQRHSPENARRILSNFSRAQDLGMAVQGEDIPKAAQAADWLGDLEQAVEGYEKALGLAGADRCRILQRLIEILLGSPKRDWGRIDGYMDQLLAEARDQPDTLLRAVQWKMQRLLAKDDIEGAKVLLAGVGSKLDVPPWSHYLQCFGAQILFRQEQYEAAECSGCCRRGCGGATVCMVRPGGCWGGSTTSRTGRRRRCRSTTRWFGRRRAASTGWRACWARPRPWPGWNAMRRRP